MDTRASIRRFIGDTFFVEDFADGDSFLQEGVIDSTGMLELVAFVEEQFSVKLEDAELIPQNLDSLDNLCRFLETKQKNL